MDLPWQLFAVALFAMTLGGGASALPRQQTGCGYVARSRPFIINGRDATEEDLLGSPWHVGLYRSKDGPQHYEQICGGTLVHRRVVVTAAHCLYRGTTLYGELLDVKDVRVSVGSATRAWSETHSGHSQQLKVSEIIAHPNYGGPDHGLTGDIGVLILATSVIVSEYVKPACMVWSSFDGPTLTDQSVGKVVGWGLTGLDDTAKPSPVLKVAELPFIPRERCFKTVPIGLWSTITRDKFCAGHINGTMLGRGDSGGGLTFEHNGLWYLMGIVSSGSTEALTYSTFTTVPDFSDWIGGIIDKTERDEVLIRNGFPPPPAVSKYISDFLETLPHDDERTETVVAEYPWAALVGTKDTNGGTGLSCFQNGVLISNRYVLTTTYAARYCNDPLTVRLGEHVLASHVDCSIFLGSGMMRCAPPAVDVPVAEVIHYPVDANGNGYDITLIRLAHEVDFSDYVRPLSLPPPEQANCTGDGGSEVGVQLTAVTWGRTNDNSTNMYVYAPLIQLRTNIVPLDQCQTKRYPLYAEFHVCVASITRKEGYGICRALHGTALIGSRQGTPATPRTSWDSHTSGRATRTSRDLHTRSSPLSFPGS